MPGFTITVSPAAAASRPAWIVGNWSGMMMVFARAASSTFGFSSTTGAGGTETGGVVAVTTGAGVAGVGVAGTGVAGGGADARAGGGIGAGVVRLGVGRTAALPVFSPSVNRKAPTPTSAA